MIARFSLRKWLLVVISLCIVAACAPERTSPAAEATAFSMGNASFGQTRVRDQDGMQMMYVPRGSFMMGSSEDEFNAAIHQCRQYYEICNSGYFSREAPQHQVNLSAFWIDQTEVTNAQYQRCVEQGGCTGLAVCDEGHGTMVDGKRDDHPVVCVDWEQANVYCAWVGGRLPTEAEWEYAYRGPLSFLYPWGDEFDGTRLNYCDQNCPEDHADSEFDDGFSITAPVGSYPNDATWVGALDMTGNVFEWVGDWFGPYDSGPQTDPVGPENGTQRVMRGGSWYYHPARVRGAARDAVSPETRFDSIGFRCVIPSMSN